ncbi:MAG: DUF1045 domain-containing protein [Pseudomonadota bacterium]
MRYALFFTPPQDHAVTRTASKWLGRDAFTNETISYPDRSEALVSAPRKYGFHATLKAPFRLSATTSEAELLSAVKDFSDQQIPFEVALEVGQIGPFFALVEAEANETLSRHSQNIVQHFDPFRSPLRPNEMKRRKPETLSSRQRRYLERWGYPFVFEEFQFHMTLTGPVGSSEADPIKIQLKTLFDGLLTAPMRIDALCVFVQPSPDAPFTVLQRSPFQGA